MDPEAYERFSRDLESTLESDPRVLGLVAVGSMARQGTLPDRWSDHDFFVVVARGAQESFRTNLVWLPRHDEIVLSFRETAHGVKALFRDGHLVEFAVFDPDELAVARVNRYRVLFDRERIDARLSGIAATTAARTTPPSDEWLVGQFLTSLLVGAGRHSRGERLSGRQLVKSSALAHLVVLLTQRTGSPRTENLDSLDPCDVSKRCSPRSGAGSMPPSRWRLRARRGRSSTSPSRSCPDGCRKRPSQQFGCDSLRAARRSRGPASEAGTLRSRAERASRARLRWARTDRPRRRR